SAFGFLRDIRSRLIILSLRLMILGDVVLSRNDLILRLGLPRKVFLNDPSSPARPTFLADLLDGPFWEAIITRFIGKPKEGNLVVSPSRTTKLHQPLPLPRSLFREPSQYCNHQSAPYIQRRL